MRILSPGVAPWPLMCPCAQPIGSTADWFNALSVKDSGVLYEDPHLQVGTPLE